MHHKSTKKLSFKAAKVEKSFTCENLTSYSGLTVINAYVNQLGLPQGLSRITLDCDSTEATVFGHQEYFCFNSL